MRNKLILLFILNILFFSLFANNSNRLFYINPYHVYDINYWFIDYKKNPENKVLLLDKKLATQNFNNLKCHFYDLKNCRNSQSPWSKIFINNIINNIQNQKFLLPNDSYFRFNKYPIEKNFLQEIFNNMGYIRLESLKFNKANFAITTSNTNIYVLPVREPIFKSESILGQGYPFNLNLISSLPVAMPLYVIFDSYDKLWSLVVTPYFIGWIRQDQFAYVDSKFIHQYQKLANRNLVSIIDPSNKIVNNDNYQNFLPGTILPSKVLDESRYQLYLPFRNYDGRGKIYEANINKKFAYDLPYPLTKENILEVLTKLIGRPYGWGGYLNYNDCSLEMQMLWQLFGYFMPRNSSQQTVLGNIIDLSNKDTKERINFLNNYNQPFTSLIFIKGHIMLYLGSVNYDNAKVPLIYNNIWGLSDFNKTHKYIIGGSSILPLLENYPEDETINSLINYPLFQIIEINRNYAFDVDMTNSMKILNLD